MQEVLMEGVVRCDGHFNRGLSRMASSALRELKWPITEEMRAALTPQKKRGKAHRTTDAQ